MSCRGSWTAAILFSHFSFQRPTVFLVSLFLSLPSACKVSLAHVAPPSLLSYEQGNISRTLLYFFSSFYLLSSSFLSRYFFFRKKSKRSLFLFFFSLSFLLFMASIPFIMFLMTCIQLLICWILRWMNFQAFFFLGNERFWRSWFFLKLTVFLLLFSCFPFSLLSRKPELLCKRTHKQGGLLFYAPFPPF